MTRVNAGLDPKTLKRMHLLAELREITMVPASLARSLRTKSQSAVLKSIPATFTLNTGHVKFFYNKLTFLVNRFDLLADEMERRGYSPDRGRKKAFDGFAECFYNNWTPTDAANTLITKRIELRISQKPHLYED